MFGFSHTIARKFGSLYLATVGLWGANKIAASDKYQLAHWKLIYLLCDQELRSLHNLIISLQFVLCSEPKTIKSRAFEKKKSIQRSGLSLIDVRCSHISNY